MTVELKLLAFGTALGLVQIVLAAHAASRQRGYLWTAGSRDEAVPPLTGLAGRLERALRNFLETFPLFAAAILIAHAADKHGWLTQWGLISTSGSASPAFCPMPRGSSCCARFYGTWPLSASS